MSNDMGCQRRSVMLFGVVLLSIFLFFAQVSLAFSPPPPGPGSRPGYRPPPPGRPPVSHGRVVPHLPVGFATFIVGEALYYSFAGSYYRQAPNGYIVVANPEPGVAQQPVATNGTIRVVVQALNIRTGPGIQSPIISTAYANTVLPVVNRVPGWVHVLLPNGGLGWVADIYTVPY